MILRAKRHLNEIVVDQIPSLTDVQRAFEELTFLEPPSGTEEKFKNSLVIEQLPRIATIVEGPNNRSFNEIVIKLSERLRSREAAMEDAQRMAKLFDQLMGPEGEEDPEKVRQLAEAMVAAAQAQKGK